MISRLLAVGCSLTLIAIPMVAQSNPVPTAINQLGLDLLRAPVAAGAGDKNALLSPYSISTALAMAYVGADGVTREEMRRVLHLLPADDAAVVAGFSGLVRELVGLEEASRRRVEEQRRHGAENEPIEINIANRLFVQTGYALRPAFTALVREQFSAPLEELDFLRAAEPARLRINTWVAGETHDKIRHLVPEGAINADTRAVLANAIYLRAPWADAFQPERTKSEPFWTGGKARMDVPTMLRQGNYRYEKRDGFVALALPYVGGDLQFVILLPDERDGLSDLERTVTSAMLAECAGLPFRDVVLRLPKFKLEPPSLALGALLRGLGMATAFDQPPGSANFDRMAPRKPDDYLFISEVIHKTWLSLDEKGTEAAAATAVVMFATSAASQPKPPPIDVRVDRPFLFAIQHVRSGACLFLGCVVDPR